MARHKEVYPTDEIAHLWAHKTQESARNPQGNLYFEGDTIYSYRDSFPIAKHVTSKSGRPGVLITRDTYSNTTARHISGVRRAIAHRIDTWEVDSPTDGTPQQLESWARRIKDKSVEVIQLRIRKATAAKRYEDLQELVAQANSFAEFFGVKAGFSVPEFGELKEKLEAEALKLAAKQKRDAVRDQKRRAEQEREYREKTAAQLEEWIAGVPHVYPPRLPEAYLRITDTFHHEEGSERFEVETSLGARVPIAHAIKATKLVRRLLEQNFPMTDSGGGVDGELPLLYKRNGHSIRLGHYTLDSIDIDGTIRARCHVIKRREFERFSKVLDEWQASQVGVGTEDVGEALTDTELDYEVQHDAN